MEIYAVRNDGFKYQELDLEVNDFIEEFPEKYDYGQAHDFCIENIAMSGFWKLKKTGFSEIEGEENLIPDITKWIDSTLLLSPRAHRFLADSLNKYGEFLPVVIGKETYQIFNCLTLVDVLEDKSSETNIIFNPESIGENLIFKTRFQHCFDLYCLPRFKVLIEELNLKGVVFDTHLGSFRE